MAGGHIFISYSSHDAERAQELCDALEKRGLACWIAPRDVEAGAYAASIIRAIRSAGALVLVASEHSGRSQHVRRELERAVDSGAPIVPLRIDDADFPEDVEYYLAGMHWLDVADRPVAGFADDLAERLRGVVRSVEAPLEADAEDAPAAAPTRGRRRLTERLLDALLAAPPPLVGVALAVVGGVFVLLGALIGVADFSYPLETEQGTVMKQVGFFWALNWSLSVIMIYPAVAGIGLQALREMAALPAALSRRRMVVDESFRPVPPGYAEREIRGALGLGIAAALGIAVVSISYAVWEFHTIVGQHYTNGLAFPESVRVDDPFQERDWSVAALLPGGIGVIDPAANYVFALAVYIYLVGFGTAVVLGVFISFLAVSAAIYRLSVRARDVRIVPDLRSPVGRRKFDPRCGFEIFEPLFSQSLIVVLLSFISLFLVNLQNTYIRGPAPDIVAYVTPDLAMPGGALAELAGDGGSAFANLSGAVSTALTGTAFAIIVFGMAITLRIGARQAHAHLVARIEDVEEPLPAWLEDTGRETALERLDEMRFWPMRWLGLNHILVAITLAAVSLALHRVGVAVAALGLVYVAVSTFGGGRARR